MACIEDLREKREELNRSLLRDEEEKSKIQKELSTLTERLSRLNEDLARKMQVRGGPAAAPSALRAGVPCGGAGSPPPLTPHTFLALLTPLHTPTPLLRAGPR